MSAARSSTHFGQRDDRDEAKSKTQGCIPVQIMRSCGHGDKEQQEVRPGAEDEPSERGQPGWFVFGLKGRDKFVVEGGGVSLRVAIEERGVF